MLRVGRNEILNWINDLLQLDYKKIEQMGSGAALCQIIDVIHPGRINLKMVNFNAKYDYEYVKNFSYLQEAFAKIGIEKYVEVSELVKSRPQANLEFCQWLKKYFDQFYNGEAYNALERRQQLKILTDRDKVLLKGKAGTSSIKPAASKPTASATSKPVAAATKPTTTAAAKPAAPATKPVAAKPTPTATKPATTKPAPAPATATVKTTTTPVKTIPTTTTTTTTKPLATPAKTGKPTLSQPTFKPTTPKPVSPTPPSQPTPATVELQKEVESYKAQVQELNDKLQALSDSIKEIESDRDFYFDRLRAAEIFCQENEEPILKKVLSILYNTESTGEEGEEGESIEGEEKLEEEEEQENHENNNDTLSEPEPEPEIEEDITNATENLAINEEPTDEFIEEDQQLEEIEQEEEEEETIDGMNEDDIMNKLQEEDEDEEEGDQMLNTTFDASNELIADEQEEF
ncbi:hypothetical protein DICPUDRAFT_99773 [Dictyostelium purpureum]|uniref:Calponin-homology (CH) domain-containing protein n=1 Tax=Dictyostelium purpureum TaxID=5786 RepID=F1A2E4_DICPU|nr:uncharacterized protein DICPUDRAFT_99773 [Dictyostelium purpureum]EGC29633.1 hypothetical protein DICPUDRAFT_99773 [Dictyostelium purpureum]|eukprot:XP_003293837.1 hypothetical protein DICPUDRAFT_99773 [Dictyostelium purpureum]